HHRGAELAAVEAAGVVDAHLLQAERAGAVLHVVAQRLAALVGAAAARMAVGPFVGAAENLGVVVGAGVGRLLAVAKCSLSCPKTRCWSAAHRKPAGSAASARRPASRAAARS